MTGILTPMDVLRYLHVTAEPFIIVAEIEQLIDASDVWQPMRKSLGDKRRYIGEGEDGDPNQVGEILTLYETLDEDEDRVQIFDTEDFGYRKVRVERRLRLKVVPSEERIEQKFNQLRCARKRPDCGSVWNSQAYDSCCDERG